MGYLHLRNQSNAEIRTYAAPRRAKKSSKRLVSAALPVGDRCTALNSIYLLSNAKVVVLSFEVHPFCLICSSSMPEEKPAYEYESCERFVEHEIHILEGPR
jgi:hypothetical protein